MLSWYQGLNVCQKDFPRSHSTHTWTKLIHRFISSSTVKLNFKITSNMLLLQEHSEWQHSCTTACWEFRSSRALIGGVLSAGRFSAGYCVLGEFFISLFLFIYPSVISLLNSSTYSCHSFFLHTVRLFFSLCWIYILPLQFFIFDQFFHFCPFLSLWLFSLSFHILISLPVPVSLFFCTCTFCTTLFLFSPLQPLVSCPCLGFPFHFVSPSLLAQTHTF